MAARLFSFILLLPLWAVAESLPYQVVNKHAHDITLFTQGLAIDEGQLFESSGLYGKSFVQSRPLPDAANDENTYPRDFYLPAKLFAEGLALANDSIYVLTWREEQALVLDRQTLLPKKRIPYAGEGWGLSFDGKHLVMSDGSETLSFRKPENFDVIRRIKVRDPKGKAQRHLNELEWVNGWILANVWKQNYILLINPNNGDAEHYIDIRALVPNRGGYGRDSVANGIAFDTRSGHLWVTGKGWPYLYEIRITLPPAPQPALSNSGQVP